MVIQGRDADGRVKVKIDKNPDRESGMHWRFWVLERGWLRKSIRYTNTISYLDFSSLIHPPILPTKTLPHTNPKLQP